MKTFTLTSVLLLFTSIISAQSLWINNPQNWKGGQGTIEESLITYQPQGLFMRVDWELEFSARDLAVFSEKDTVEVVYNFSLPEGSVINDSWLWFGDTILKALIMDRWSASQVYESIVKRRRDPSILTKNGSNNYELRIFPMAAKESRRVKISYLVPAGWSQKYVSAGFPSANLLVSKNAPRKLELLARLGSEWKTPVLTGGTANQPLPVETDKQYNATHRLKIDFKALTQNQQFRVNSPMKNGYYLNIFEKGKEKFYQLALFPAEGLNIRTPQKVVFLVDFQKENTKITQGEMLRLFADNMTDLMNAKDSFNILYYDFELQQASKTWIPGDSVSIRQTVKNLGENPFVSYSNLASLLAAGIDYAKKNPGSKIILLANSNKINDVEVANSLIADLMKRMNPVIPVFIGDFQAGNYNYSWIKNVNYRGNEYFYRNLAKLTGGDYCHSFDGDPFQVVVRKIYELATNETGLIDIHTKLNAGLCYGRYILSPKNLNLLTNIYLETGRYSGEFPFEAEISGLYADEIFSRKITIPKSAATVTDSVTGVFWYSREMQDMENSSDAYSLIKEIIDKSIKNRILSNYTAFLCLEPGMMDELNNVKDNENIILYRDWTGKVDVAIPTSADKVEIGEPEIKAYPNPFTSKINIEVQLAETLDAGVARMEIYDLFGKRVTEFSISEFNGQTEIKLSWDGTDSAGNKIPKGTYLFICSTKNSRITKKLVFM